VRAVVSTAADILTVGLVELLRVLYVVCIGRGVQELQVEVEISWFEVGCRMLLKKDFEDGHKTGNIYRRPQDNITKLA
jgi:hypothetical protein